MRAADSVFAGSDVVRTHFPREPPDGGRAALKRGNANDPTGSSISAVRHRDVLTTSTDLEITVKLHQLV